MTDRDHFAAAALTGLLGSGDLVIDPRNGTAATLTARDAYRWADAMLREREQTAQKMAESDSLRAACTDHDAAPAARADSRPLGNPVASAVTGTGKQPAPPCVETDRPPCDMQSPAASDGSGRDALRDVARPDTKGKVAGGPEPKSLIDVEELLGELHVIAGSGDHVEYDIRRTACEAEHAIDRLRAWVNELQLSKAEIDALQHVVEDGKLVDLSDYGHLRSLLVRLRPEWGEEESDSPKPIADCDIDRPKPISDDRMAALEELSALDQKLELEYGLTGNPLIKARQHMRSKNCCYCEKPHGKSSPLIFQSCDACQDERDKRAIDFSNSLTDEERQAIQWAATVSEGLCQMGAKDRAAALRGLLERMGGVQ